MKCIICGSDISEGRQVCERCEGIISEHKEIIAAMFNKSPAEYEGAKYGCISAFTVRTRASHHHVMPTPYIVQVELMSRLSHSVVIADPKKVKIL